jgi:ribosomal protein S18
MTEKEEFLPFETIQKNLEKIINGWAEKKMGQKITFFSKPENEKYVTWKALPMLKKYMTRFGNIKPRRYTANPVSIQKKVRQSIIRAREM